MRTQLRRGALAVGALGRLQVQQRFFMQAERAAGAVGGVVGADRSLLRRLLAHLGDQPACEVARPLGIARGQVPVGQRCAHAPDVSLQAARLRQFQRLHQQRLRQGQLALQQQRLAEVAGNGDLVGVARHLLQQRERTFTLGAAGGEHGAYLVVGAGVAQPVRHAQADRAHAIGGHQQRMAGRAAAIGRQRFAEQPHRLPGVAHALQAHREQEGRCQRVVGPAAAARSLRQGMGGVQRHVEGADLACRQRHVAQQLALHALEARRLQARQHGACARQRLGMAAHARQVHAAPGLGLRLFAREAEFVCARQRPPRGAQAGFGVGAGFGGGGQGSSQRGIRRGGVARVGQGIQGWPSNGAFGVTGCF